jgi:hypothetical protein
LDSPLKKILNLPIGKSIIFRRGEAPSMCENINLFDIEKSYGYKIPGYEKVRSVDKRSLQERLRGKAAEKKDKKLEEKKVESDKEMKKHYYDPDVEAAMESIFKIMKTEDGTAS